MSITLTPEARTLLAEKGYDPVLGARPLRRAIQRDIEDSLSEKILFGQVKDGDEIVIDAEGEGPLGVFTFATKKEDGSLEPISEDISVEDIAG